MALLYSCFHCDAIQVWLSIDCCSLGLCFQFPFGFSSIHFLFGRLFIGDEMMRKCAENYWDAIFQFYFQCSCSHVIWDKFRSIRPENRHSFHFFSQIKCCLGFCVSAAQRKTRDAFVCVCLFTIRETGILRTLVHRISYIWRISQLLTKKVIENCSSSKFKSTIFIAFETF